MYALTSHHSWLYDLHHLSFIVNHLSLCTPLTNFLVMSGNFILVDVPPSVSNYQLIKAQSSSSISYLSVSGAAALSSKIKI